MFTSMSTVSVANAFLVSDASGWTTSQFSIDRRLFTLNCQNGHGYPRVGHLRVVSFARWVVSGRTGLSFLGHTASPGLDVYPPHLYRTCRPSTFNRPHSKTWTYRDSVPFRRLIGLDANANAYLSSLPVPAPITFCFTIAEPRTLNLEPYFKRSSVSPSVGPFARSTILHSFASPKPKQRNQPPRTAPTT